MSISHLGPHCRNVLTACPTWKINSNLPIYEAIFKLMAFVSQVFYLRSSLHGASFRIKLNTYMLQFAPETTNGWNQVPEWNLLKPQPSFWLCKCLMSCNNLLPLLFADDTSLIAAQDDFNSLIAYVNEELCTVSKWFQINKLTHNVKKCNFMIFCNKNKSYLQEEAKLLINGSEISQVPHTTFLGVIVNDGLNWNYHIDQVCKRSMKMLGLLGKVCPLIHPSAHLTLYCSFLFPYINYCNIVWAATYPAHINKLLIIQKRFLRMISQSTRHELSAPLFRKYSIWSIHKLSVFHSDLFTHKFINNKQDLPETFHNFYILSSHIHSYQTRHSNGLHLLFCRTSSHQFNISFRGPKVWNDLPLFLRLTSQSSFKRLLKSWAFKSIYHCIIMHTMCPSCMFLCSVDITALFLAYSLHVLIDCSVTHYMTWELMGVNLCTNLLGFVPSLHLFFFF